MKKYMILIILTLMFAPILCAQTDRFFDYQYEQRENKNNDWSELIMLPNTHGLEYDYPADNVPINSGILLLLKMGLLYVFMKKDKKRIDNKL